MSILDGSYHSENLANHCRICGTAFPRGCKDKKAKKDLQKLVKACYNIDASGEDHQVYPEYVCLKCLAQMRRIEAAKDTKYINPAVVLFNWQPHTDSDCEICEHFAKYKKGGGPKKSRKNRGRVTGETTTQTVTSIQAVCIFVFCNSGINILGPPVRPTFLAYGLDMA